MLARIRSKFHNTFQYYVHGKKEEIESRRGGCIKITLTAWTHERYLRTQINPAGLQTLSEETEDKSIHPRAQWDSKPKPSC